MDQPTASPDAQDRPATSPDPAPTRPNPFDDDTNSARKRRRTSPVGSSSSLASDSAMDQTDDSPTADASAMNIDQNTSHPTTPDQSSAAPELTPQLSSSRVTTINLRHHGGLDGAASPTTPSREPTCNGQPRLIPDDQKMQDARPDTGRDSFESEGGTTPVSSTIATNSPEAHLVEDPVDAAEALGEPEITILGEQPVFDFARDFPFQGDAHQEPLCDAVDRIMRFLETSHSSGTEDEDVIFQLLGWMNQCVGFFRRLDMDRTIACISGHQAFWARLRDLIVQISFKRSRYPVGSSARITSNNFLRATSDVVAVLVKTDLDNLARHRNDSNFADAIPFVTSSPMLDAFATSVRQMTMSGSRESPYATLHEDGDLNKRFLDADGGGLSLLVRLAQAQVALLPRHPQLADNLDYPSSAVAGVLSMTRALLPENLLPPQQSSAAAKARLAIGLQYFDVVATAFSTLIDKSVTHLSPFHTENLIGSLSETLTHGLAAGHDAATQRLVHLHEAFPDVPNQYIAHMASWEWRLGVLCRLIKSSQMQLRVMALRVTCDELVQLWKNSAKDFSGNAFLESLARHLDGLGIVDYVLDSTCHPEITAHSGNIVGFILVTGQYRDDHTDLLWRSITGVEDARNYDSLGRFVQSVLHMFTRASLHYLLSKFQDLRLADMSPIVITVLSQVLNYYLPLLHNEGQSDPMLVELLLRLLREAWLLRPDSSAANPEVNNMVMEKMRMILAEEASADIRAKVLADCCADIASKSVTTLGSMWCLLNLVRLGPASATDLQTLTVEHDFPRIIIEEIEHAAQDAPSRGLSTILQRAGNMPRVQFLSYILRHEARTITDDLGIRLLDVLVGPNAISQDDREAAWRMLNRMGTEVAYDNPFLHACFTQYLPRLSPSHIHPGTLDFVKGILLRNLNSPNSVPSVEQPRAAEDNSLDGGENLVQVGIEQLWRMLLSTENQSLAENMVRTLVDDVYVGSAVIQSYPHCRARQVHLAVVDRCLSQLEVAAEQLRADREADVMPSLPDESSVNERVFARSLAVLRVFMAAYQSNKLFSAPDLRPLMPRTPGAIQGEPADLKYQSSAGQTQTGMLPVVIGCQNTAGDLLATLREATGFENYRLYHSGVLFTPEGPHVAISLEDLHLISGLLLVIQETPCVAAPANTMPGTSALQIEVLRHFPQLWSYLSMQSSLACQIYQVLTSLPADSQILEMIESPTSTHQDIFPRGEPYKCLYATYALDMYLQMARQPTDGNTEDAQVRSAAAILRTRTLVADALADTHLLGDHMNVLPKHQLSSSLMRLYLQTLQSMMEQGGTSVDEVGTPAVDRLVELLESGLQSPRHEHSLELVQVSFEALLLTSALNTAFWADFKEHTKTDDLIQNMLLQEQDGLIRQHTRAAIFERCGISHMQLDAQNTTDLVQMAVPTAAFRQFFWQMFSILIPDAVRLSSQASNFFEVVHGLARHLMVVEKSDYLDVHDLVRQCCLLLENYETTEVLGVAYAEDAVLLHLLSILKLCFWTQDKETLATFDIPPRFAENLFWQHLFPRDRRRRGDGVSPTVFSPRARQLLYEIVQTICTDSEESTSELARALVQVTPFDKTDEEFGYNYEMGWNIDRASEIRAECGYAGLRNLSNTCYMNSLMTQLFMNTKFRDFMINAPVHDQNAQELLIETQKIFSHLQDTNRRFVDPEQMFLSIKTSNNEMIDASQQMDVDEFYNLLFDRWESQLPEAKVRQNFRTFYGGQLVQQVSSKECEHISERFEPFSAIQCDVSGRRNLAASLQAYVDGEVLSGDNKYKCSKCDRHVDAVKRACLKDIPDNLIFHLKRFDFNLRSMMRRKINDHFAFPAQINMRPYTIEQLSDPSQKLEPDIFELVGVLVHTGTAETGHYYSYIRERPTTREGQTWLEFNDDSVTFWDHANMEEATFGALPRTQDQAEYTLEKAHNAYMLFYERSSALKAQQAAVLARQVPTPLKVDLPDEMFETIMNDNTAWLQRHCLFDEHHLHFTMHFCNRILSQQPGESAANRRLGKMAMQILLGVFDQAVTRTKSLSFLNLYVEVLQAAVVRSSSCALALIQYFSETQEPFRQLVQRNPDAEVRSMTVYVFMSALRKLRSMDSDAYGMGDNIDDIDTKAVGNCMDLFDVLWRQFQVNMRAWPEVFDLITRFAHLGDFEVALLLQGDWLTRAMLVIATDSTFGKLPEVYRKLNSVLMRRKQSGTTRGPSYYEVVGLVARLMSRLSDTVEEPCIDTADRMDFYVANPGEKLPWCHEEVHVLSKEYEDTGSVFVRRLLEVGGDVPATQAIISLLANGDKEMQYALVGVMRGVFRRPGEVYSLRPFLAAIHTYVESQPQLSSSFELIDLVLRTCREPGPDGGHLLQFFRSIHTTLASHQNVRIPKEVLQMVPLWGPPLLGYPNKVVARNTESYITNEILPSEFDEDDDGQLGAMMAEKARELARRCLDHLRRHFLGRPNTAESIANLQNIIAHCENFYADQEPGSQGSLAKSRDEIYTQLQFNLVEELDEEGSDWEQSVASSGALESLADALMQTAGEVPDVQMR